MMVDENTPQPDTLDYCDDNQRCWRQLEYSEHQRINPMTAQGDHSTQVQLEFGKWAKGNGTWYSVSSYVENVKLWYAATTDITWNGNYKRGMVTYQNESGDDYDEIYETEYDGMEIIS